MAMRRSANTVRCTKLVPARLASVPAGGAVARDETAAAIELRLRNCGGQSGLVAATGRGAGLMFTVVSEKYRVRRGSGVEWTKRVQWSSFVPLMRWN